MTDRNQRARAEAQIREDIIDRYGSAVDVLVSAGEMLEKLGADACMGGLAEAIDAAQEQIETAHETARIEAYEEQP